MNHNFHKLSCRVVQQTQYYSACQAKYRKVKAGKPGCTNKRCVAALEQGACPAAKMIVAEMTGQGRFYLDRDDAGPGVVSRASLDLPPRTAEEIDRHRKMAEANKVKVIVVEPAERMQQIMAHRRWQERAAGWTPGMRQQLRRSGLSEAIEAPIEDEPYVPLRRLGDTPGDTPGEAPAAPAKREVIDLNDLGGMITAAVAEEAADAAA